MPAPLLSSCSPVLGPLHNPLGTIILSSALFGLSVVLYD